MTGHENTNFSAMEWLVIPDPNSYKSISTSLRLFVEALKIVNLYQINDFENNKILKSHSHNFETFFRTVA